MQKILFFCCTRTLSSPHEFNAHDNVTLNSYGAHNAHGSDARNAHNSAAFSAHEINEHDNVALNSYDVHGLRRSATYDAHRGAIHTAHDAREFSTHSDVALDPHNVHEFNVRDCATLNSYDVCTPHEHHRPYGYGVHDVHAARNTRAHAPQNYPDHALFVQHHPTFADYPDEAQDTRVFPRKSLLSPNSVRV